MSKSQVGVRMWFVFILVGLAGQFAWSIENMYLNTYITYLNFTSKDGGFDYNLMIAITTAASAAVATLTTIFIGNLTDRIGKKKLFISIGYIIWGVATASFGLFNVNSSTSFIVMSSFLAATMVVIIDCVMTFFGSSSNDAAFNAYVTSHVDDAKRGKVEGVLQILSLISMLIIFVGFNNLTTKQGGYRWDLFFYILGGIVSLVGIISLFLIPKEKDEGKKDTTYLGAVLDGFKPKTVVNNKKLYLILTIYFIFACAQQIFFPYLLVYIEKTCEISSTSTSFLSPFVIVMAVALIGGSALSVLVGILGDKFSKNKMIIPSLGIMFTGTLIMMFIPFVGDSSLRTFYACLAGLIMITGCIGVPTILNALVREYIPVGKEGSFMGIRMLFVVALPMCIGPFIGSALNNSFGKTYVGDFGVSSPLPSNYSYLVGSLFLLLTCIPLFFYFKEVKNEKRNQQM